MEKSVTRNIKVGIIVIAGLVFLTVGLYVIGDKQNLFGNTFRISALFYNVNGLMKGNNVRLAGIDVGTVDKVELMSDSTVRVTMLIEDKVRKFIRKNALVSIGTDGLMGNKLVNINSVNGPSELIEEGDELHTLRPIETDEMLRTLNTTNENIKFISSDLKKITGKFNSPNTLWSLLMDTVIAVNVKSAIVDIRLAGNNTAILTGDLSSIVSDVKAGKGSIGSLLTDTSLSGNLDQAIVDIQQITEKMAIVSGDLSKIVKRAESGEGAVGTLLMDTAFVEKLNQSMQNIESGTKGFNENMEALKHSFLLRGYFRKQEKQESKRKRNE